MALVRVEFKVRALIEADNLPQAMDAAASVIDMPSGFLVDGNAAICRSKPKWWGKRSPLSIEQVVNTNQHKKK